MAWYELWTRLGGQEWVLGGVELLRSLVSSVSGMRLITTDPLTTLVECVSRLSHVCVLTKLSFEACVTRPTCIALDYVVVELFTEVGVAGDLKSHP